MTVPVSDRLSQLYVGNGTNTRFDFTFRIFQQEDATGVAVRKKGTTDFETIDPATYTVTINPDDMGGYITFNTPPTVGTYFYIAGASPLDQLLDITNYDNFYPDAIERALDKLTALLQEWGTKLDLEKQARILADIHYDSLAMEREENLENRLISYINAVVGITNPNIFDGISDRMIITKDGRTQREFNDTLPYWTDDYANFKQQTFLREEQILEHVKQEDASLDQKINAENIRAIQAEQVLDGKIAAIGGGASHGYTSYTEMVADAANIPANSVVTVGGDPDSTKDGDYIYNGTTFSKSPYDPLTQSKNYTNSFSSLTKNSTVVYPFISRKRNNVNESAVPVTHEAFLKPYILSVRVMNANKDHYYRVQQISNPDHATAANRWIFEILARGNFETAETRISTITAVLPIVKNSGIRDFLVEDGDVKIAITLDTNKCPAFDFYSVASTDSSYTYIIDPSLYFYAAVGSSDLAVINKRIDGFIKPMQLQNLLKDLRNPIQSVQIKLIGDSITYGLGATDNGSGGGVVGVHGPATTKTWANLLRNYLGTTFCTSSRFGDDTISLTGEAYYTSDGTSVLSAELSNFTFKNSATGKVFTVAEMQALVGSIASSPVGTFIDLRSPALTSVIAPTDMEFLFNGNEFTINHARLGNGSATESFIDVYVDDVLHSSFNVYTASTPDFLGAYTVSGLADGQKKIRIANRLTNTTIYARLVSITATRKISVINEGVSGWNTGSWLSGDNISNKISIKDNYVIMMLGTNDRHTTQKIGTFKNNYLQLLDRIGAKNSKAQIIVMAPPAVTQSEDPSTGRLFRIADLNYAISQIAQLRSISMINLFEATSKLKAQGIEFLLPPPDQLHPNDYGYGVIAEYIINQILNA
ncbi:TPA: GDSL-type esterase/lipase family protein [Acinetobacter baumannii]